jgi:hypothetical protein
MRGRNASAADNCRTHCAQIDHRHTGNKPQRAHLIRRRYPGPNLLVEMIQPVSELVEPRIDSTGTSGVGLKKRGALQARATAGG